MRWALAILAVLGGCLGPPGLDDPVAGSVRVEPLDFDAVEGPWTLRMSTGCGFCSGQGGFRATEEHVLLAVLDGLRALRLAYTSGRLPPGEAMRVWLDRNITFPAGDVAALLRDVPFRAEGREVFVVRLTTARLAGPGALELPDRLDALWARPGPPADCADCSTVRYWLRLHGATREAEFDGPRASSDPIVPFADLVRALDEEVAARGRTEGIPRP